MKKMKCCFVIVAYLSFVFLNIQNASADYSRPIKDLWDREAYRDETNQTDRYKASDYWVGTVFDLLTRLIWEQTPSEGKFTWNEGGKLGSAQAYCATLNEKGLDWRVPNVMELQSLIDYSKRGNRIDPIFSSDPEKQVYWTSARLKGSSEVLGLRMGDGVLESLSADSKQRVRCVSGFRNAMSLEYTNNNPGNIEPGIASASIKPYGQIVEGTVRFYDGITGLCWASKSFSHLNHSEATILCAHRTHFLEDSSPKELVERAEKVGPRSWRLPSIKEVVTLVDYKSGKFRLHETVQPSFESKELYYWTSTPHEERPNSFAVISLKDGSLSYVESDFEDPSKCILARCVDRK
ncbi:MAG: DUF1566 domain-containing protein [Myxococcaceae bacterium]|nr:DUF1566 domain-containing protein [Myxococcaceae bacterium]MBH2005868.1 DUF1566 domain-containing protein [Myxococcaceae bacterium]